MICQAWTALLECAREGGEPRNELLAHLRSCQICEQRFERERALTARFSALRQAGFAPTSGSDRHAELIHKFKAMERPRPRAIWAIGVAAMLLVGIALMGTWQVRPRTELAENFGEADGYTAIPYAVPLATGEFVRVLQADLPASSLEQMGLDVEGYTAEPIPVDLIVGEDGQPRAVRILSDDFSRSSLDSYETNDAI